MMKLSANDSSACIALAAAAAADDDHDDDDDDDPRLMTTTIASRDASVYNRHHASMYSLDLPAKFKRLMFLFLGHVLVQFHTAFVPCRHIRSVLHVSLCLSVANKFDLI